MSEYNDIAGSEDIISLTYETQETFNEQSYRTKQSANRIDKNMPIKEQAKENQRPIVQVNDEEVEAMQADTQNYSQAAVNNGVSAEQPSSSIDAQNTLSSNNPFIIRPPLAQSTLSDEDSLQVQSPIHEERNTATESTSKSKDLNASGNDTSTTTNNLRLYISPSTSLLETTNIDDAQQRLNHANISPTENHGNNQEAELDDKPKEEPMDTSDAQVSLGSDGILESNPTSALATEPTSVSEKPTKVSSPTQNKISISPNSKALYSLSQPATDKFEAILAKLTTPTIVNNIDSNTTIREEEEISIKESISKTLRRYAVKVDQNGRTISRELLIERVVEENTTTRIESWQPPDKKIRRPAVKVTLPTETARKKPTKSNTPKRKTKSLKPTSTILSPKTSKSAQSDNDEEIKKNTNEESSNDEDDDDDEPSDDISGDEFIPTNSSGQSLKKGLRVFAKWTDGHFYPGIIANVQGEKYMIEFDDGAKRYVRAHDLILQSYLDPNQNVRAQTQDGYFDTGIIKRLIKKKKTGKLGYIVETNGEEKWYPLRFISLTVEQAEHLPTVNKNIEEAPNTVQGKRKRTSTVPQSPNKKTKSSIFPSPNKSQRTTFTPTRQTKLFNSMYFLLTGFNDLMDVRHDLQNSIESHGGKVIEKMPNANRRDKVYLISDKARKTAKFVDAKKLDIPCVNYTWINESVEKGEVQDWNMYALVVSEKETKINGDKED